MIRRTSNRKHRSIGAAGCAALVAICLAPAAFADLPAISLNTLFPPGARAGTTVEVTVAGGDLDDLTDLRFSHPGIFARPAADASGKPLPQRFLVAVGPGVPPGVYDARVVGRFGISLPRAFAVGELAEVVEGATSASPGGATEMAVGSTVNGVCNATAADHFRFTGRAGQRVMIDCAAREVDSRLDAVLVLSDAAGRELDRSRRGGLIDFTPPADGQYLVAVHDATYRGGPEFFYRLTVSTRPQVDFVFPPAGQAGTRGKYVLYGRNLGGAATAANLAIDGRALEQLPVEIELPAADGPASVPGVAPVSPAQVAQRGFEYRLRTERGGSNAAFILFTDAPPVAEAADNDKPDRPMKLTPPAVVVGQFFPQRDRDWLSFDAKKGDVWKLEVRSQRLGAASDPFLLVQRVTKNDKGETQSTDVQEVYDSDDSAGGADFSTASRDPGYRLEVKEDASYCVMVRDLFNTTRDDPRLTYVLSARRETPDFALMVTPVRASVKDMPATPLLRRGGSVPLRVVAVRRDGFNGDIQLSAEGLPPGVTCTGGTIPAGLNAGTLVLTAAENAGGWAGALRVVGKAEVAGAPVAREAKGAAVTFNPGETPVEALRSRLTAEFAAAVSGHDLSPVSIEPAEPKVWEGPVGGKVQVPLKLTWRAEGAGKFKLKVGGQSALNDYPEVEIDAKAATANVEIDLNRFKLPPGTYTLYARAEGKVKYTRNLDAAKAADEAKAAAEKAATDAAVAVKAAAEKLAAAKAGTDAEAVKSAEKADADAEAAVKGAEEAKKGAAARAAELGSKDVDAILYSGPIQVRVVAGK
jgi:hypothetical protein